MLRPFLELNSKLKSCHHAQLSLKQYFVKFSYIRIYVKVI